MARRRSTRTTASVGERGQPSPADYDSPWKEALDSYFELFLALLFPQAHADIDWTRGFEFLDKELQKITPAAALGRRVVDKLVKVWLKSGEEKWLLIHVEVQTWKEGDFPKRMHVYNYRLFDRFDREVISLAVLADDDSDWRPSHFGYGRWGFRTGTEFAIAKLLDFAPHWQALETNPNPFAMVVLAHLKMLETRRNPVDRQAWKVRLVKGLFERGMAVVDVARLIRFIDWLMELPPALEKLYREEIQHYDEERQMAYMTTFERFARIEELLAGIEMGVQVKFGAEGLSLMPEISQLTDVELLRSVRQAIITAATPDELRRVWTPEAADQGSTMRQPKPRKSRKRE